MTTTLVTGPVRSGKSRHAEDLLSHHAVVTYVATGRPADAADPEWAARVASHRARRPDEWRTVETHDLPAALAATSTPVLIDCLGTWLTAIADDAGWDDLGAARAAVGEATTALLDSLAAARQTLVIVTNEVGWSLVPTTPSGRFFQEELGRLNAAISRIADRVHLVVAGRVIDLSDAPVVPTEPRPRTLDA